MPLTTKKFLDQTGTGYLWSKIAEELNKKGKVDSVAAADNSITVAGTAAAPTIAIKISPKAGNSLSVQTGAGEEGLYVNAPASTVYSIAKATEAESGYSATYNLTADGVAIGASINIPKDMVVSAGSVVTKSESGAWGDAGTYIELTLANTTNDKLYVNVGDLIEYVTSGSQTGDMIMVSVSNDHKVTATITDGTITKAKLDSTVQASLGKADNALQTSDITEGTTNGAISVGGSPVAVHGLASAAYAETTDFDAAGSASDVYAAIVAMSESDINTAIANATTQVNN